MPLLPREGGDLRAGKQATEGHPCLAGHQSGALFSVPSVSLHEVRQKAHGRDSAAASGNANHRKSRHLDSDAAAESDDDSGRSADYGDSLGNNPPDSCAAHDADASSASERAESTEISARFDKFLLRRKRDIERTRLILSIAALFVMLSLLPINKSPNPCHMTRCDTVNKVITYYPLTGFQIVEQVAFDVFTAINSSFSVLIRSAPFI